MGNVGMGCIGTKIANSAASKGFDVMVCKRRQKSAEEERAISTTYLPGYSKSDFIILAAQVDLLDDKI